MTKIKVIRREGGSRVVAVTDVFPGDWQAVTVIKSKQSDSKIVITFEKVK